MDAAIARSFIGLGPPVLQGYGMTEASPVVSVNALGDNDPETVGRPLADVEVRTLTSRSERLTLLGEGRPFLILLEVAREIDERELVRRANERLKAFPRYVLVRRAIVAPEPRTVENGLLTPTLGIERD